MTYDQAQIIYELTSKDDPKHKEALRVIEKNVKDNISRCISTSLAMCEGFNHD